MDKIWIPFRALGTYVRHILTSDPASQIYDPIRSITVFAFLYIVAMHSMEVFHRDQAFKMMEFVQAVILVIGAGAGAMWARKDREG